ncbi:hypothetical protein MWG46_00220 [Escherichia coli]|nr:hypothetical protein [Escherichia coli]
MTDESRRSKQEKIVKVRGGREAVREQEKQRKQATIEKITGQQRHEAEESQIQGEDRSRAKMSGVMQTAKRAREEKRRESRDRQAKEGGRKGGGSGVSEK